MPKVGCGFSRDLTWPHGKYGHRPQLGKMFIEKWAFFIKMRHFFKILCHFLKNHVFLKAIIISGILFKKPAIFKKSSLRRIAIHSNLQYYHIRIAHVNEPTFVPATAIRLQPARPRVPLPPRALGPRPPSSAQHPPAAKGRNFGLIPVPPRSPSRLNLEAVAGSWEEGEDPVANINVFSSRPVFDCSSGAIHACSVMDLCSRSLPQQPGSWSSLLAARPR